MDSETQFLEKHKAADRIVFDEDGQVFAAEYTTCQGRPRDFPVRFFFNGGAENIRR